MSFVNPIAGYLPNSQFVLTQTNVSTDNLSCNNLSAVNASIINLTTISFTPTNVTAETIVAEVGNFSELYTTYLHASNISVDQTIGGHTANFVTVNADHSVTDALYLNEQSVVLTDQSLIKRDANQVMFIGKSDASDVTGADFLFRTGTEIDVAKLTIPRSSDTVGMIALDVDTTIQATTGIFSAVSVSDLNVADTTTLSELEVLTEASIRNLNVIGPNGLTATKGTITNFSSTNVSIGNLSISGNFNASGTSRFYNLTAEYFQSYITGVFQDMDAVTGNITTFESNNISNNILMKTTNLSAINASIDNALKVRFGITCGSVNASTTITAPKLNGTNISSTNISATSITGDVSQNLSAGFGIALTTVGGVTTIANTGGSVTDPLNLSTLNASTINVSLLNADDIEGFTKSTEYGFKSTCDYDPSVVTIANGVTVPFNEHSAVGVSPMGAYCIPDVLAYNKGLATYTIPVSGYYLFGWRIFVVSSPTSVPHLRFTINGTIGVQVGDYASNNESCTFQGYFVAGDTIKVQNGGSGAIQLDLARTRSYWYGHKLTPANNLITSTTNLSLQNLSVADDITALNIIGNISQNLAAGTGINLSTVGGITTITNTGIVTDPLNVSTLNASNVNASTITGNIGGNLVAGLGINISTSVNTGITTITNTGSITDPLNLSTLNGSVVNASTINVSTLNADEIDGFTKSTEYAFQATSNYGGNQTVNVGTVLNFNVVDEETPPPVSVSGFVTEGYDTSLKQYLIPVSGYYQFGFKAFIQDTSDSEFRIAMYQNGAMKGQGGRRASMTEDFTIILNCVKGDYIDLRGHVGSGAVYQGATHSWFWGTKLTPANNQIVSTTNLSIQNLSVTDDISALDVNSSNINTSNISAINISASTMTFDTLSSYKSITTLGDIDAIKFNASAVYISNDLTLDPGGAMRIQAVVPGNDLVFYSNPGNFFIGNFGANTLNIGSGSLNNDISISPAGVVTVDNLTSTNAITAPSATITNISATDLTIATSLTGAGNINITGDIQTTGIINGTTLTGDISGNLSAGTGIVLSTAAGVTNISNSLPYQLPISRIFAARTINNQSPNTSGNDYYTNYDQIDQTSSHVTYVAVPISTGGANTGAIIQTAGTYKITFTQQVYNNSYSNRVSWWSRATKNNAPTGAQTFIYTRSDQSQYAQWGSNSVTWIETCAVNDYLQVWTVVAKNTPLYNNNWTGLRGGTGSMLVIELLT
jgi:hypothetical protein